MTDSDGAQRAHRILRFLQEAKRRKVYISVVAYIAIAIAVVELGGAIVDALELPDATMSVITVLLMLGFPVVVVLAWIFDITTGGVVRTQALEPRRGRESARQSRADAATAAPPAMALPEVRHGPALRPREGSVTQGAGGETDSEAGLDPERVQRVAFGQLRHDLRTPVNAIIGYAEMLLEDAADEQIDEALKRIRIGGRDLLGLIDACLGVERWRAAGADVDTFACDAADELIPAATAVLDAAEQLVATCRERRRDELVPDLERIVAAARRLAETSATLPQRAGAALRPGADTAGVTHDVLVRIRPVEPGSLAIEGEGRILVIDDNPMNRDLLLRQLARNGYIIDTAADGVEALERTGERSYDVILLDVLMPRMDGVETLRRMRADERLQDTPVLMLSSLDEVDSAIRCLELGAEEYLTKPFEPTLLAARIAANIALRRLRARDRAYADHLAAMHDTVRRLSHAAFPDDVAARVLRGESRIVDAAGAASAVAVLLPRSARPEAPAALLERLDELANTVCDVAQAHDVDALVIRPYGAVIVVGLPLPVPSHAETAAALVLDLLQRLPHCTAGIHSGPAAGGVFGSGRPHYDVWGEAVETAEALAQHAAPAAAVLSPTTHALVRHRWPLTAGPVAEVAGQGHMRSWLLRADVHVTT